MKKIVFILIFLSPFISFSKEIIFSSDNVFSGEIILPGGDQTDINNAILALGGSGTIIIKGNININSTVNIPSGITLEIFTGYKLVVGPTNPQIIIKGNIVASLNQIFTIPVNHNLKIYNQLIHPEWFGICLYQRSNYQRGMPNTYHNANDDDEIRIQKAVNALITGGVIKFVGEAYSIYNSVKINVKSVRLEGFEKTYFPAESLLNHLVATKNTQFNMFEISQPGVIFSQLGFVGYDQNYIQGQLDVKEAAISRDYTFKGIYGVGTALSFNQEEISDTIPPIKDIDGQVERCNFLDFKYCIYAEGTNLKVVDNTIVGSYIGVYFNEANNDLDHQFTNPQMRGLVVDRNRFHSMGSYLLHDNLTGATCIKVLGTYGFSEDLPEGHEASYTTRGYFNQITNNFADDCKTFFEGTLDRSKISNNSILNSGDTSLKINFGLYGQITNNIIDGSWTWNPHQNFQIDNTNGFPTGHGIHVKYTHHLMIHDNKINNKRFNGIYIERSKNSSIQNNFITNFNRFSLVRKKQQNGDVKYEVYDMDIAPDGKYIHPPTGVRYNGKYDGIRIDYTEVVPNSYPPHRYNIQNIVANNVITQNHLKTYGRYGIYIGDGDIEGFVKNNFIKSHNRLVNDIKIENP